MLLRQRAILGVKWSTASSIVATGAQLLQLTVLARLLVPEDFGLMAMVMVVVGFGQAYADAGISAAIIHRQDSNSDHLSSLYWLNIFAGAFVFAAVRVFAPAVASFYGESRLIPLLRLLSSTFLIIPLGKQFEILLQRDLKFDLLAKQQIIAATAGLVAAIASAWLGQGVWSLVWGQLALVIVGTILLGAVGWRQYRPERHFNPGDLKGYLSFGLYQMGERSINFLAQRVDQILIGNLLGAQALGYYSFAFNLVIQPASRINPIVTKVAFPVFAKVQDDMLRLQRGYLKVLELLTIVNAPLLIGLSFVAPWVIPLVFGKQWTNSIILVQVLALVAFLRSTGNPVGSLLLAKGRADLGFVWNLALLFVIMPCIYFGSELAGVLGVAVSLLGLQLVLQFPAYVYLIKPLIGACSHSYIKVILKPTFLAAVMGTGIWLISLAGSGSWFGLIAQISTGLLLYVLLLRGFYSGQISEMKALVFGARETAPAESDLGNPAEAPALPAEK